MSDLKINSDRVIHSANSVRTINNAIRDDFGKVENAIRQLDASWDGSAASNAMAKFNSLKTSFCDARYNVLDEYVRFLYGQVGQGYNETESVNRSLADSFK